MSAQLPDRKSSNIELTQLTHEEAVHQTELNSIEWKGPLSLEAYLRREEHLGKQKLVRDGGLTPWALVTKDGSPRSVLSSCETIRKKALVAQNGQINEVICHGVASVFCPPEYRGKGYAGRMIKDLGETLSKWQTDGHECLFSVLYSDIGKVGQWSVKLHAQVITDRLQQFYAAHKWKPFPSAHISLPPTANSQDTPLPEAKSLYSSDLTDLCDVDLTLVRKKLMNAATSGKTIASIVPDVETLSWQHAREEFVANELYGRAPDIKGAIVGTEQGKRVWCVWMRTWYSSDPQRTKDNSLNILRLVVEDAEYTDSSAASDEGVEKAKGTYVTAAIASLLAAAQAEASRWHVGSVDIWNPSSATLAAAKQLNSAAEVTHREKDSIASLRWYGEGSIETIEWMDNEKYAWC
ncbi:hypothetical protein E4T38_09777 [Aureobasidium subglaciale]|nr:hypothetical protein E4T38_09777 [Aureobasidium subglaciale]KAI5213418.1 hypothetical protein E4T40_09749 [Aureobasidium subglaciale]KAI5214910.1 hypothetical protein E4T41_09778 [Aureobasidium subglaciale]KAI5252991.1 hypothetical protein E4T46_09754 [Aureobasidium subglaciale]